MPATTHKDKLIIHFDRIEYDRANLISQLDDLSQEQLHFRRSPEKWTILQILDHLITSEKLSVKYIKRITSTPENLERSGFQSKFRIFALKLALILPFKYKAPKISDATGKDPEYEKLKLEWEQIRKDLRKQINSLDKSILKGEILKHPIVGMLNMKQTLQFFDIHFNHHKKQIENIIQLTLSESKN
jgi:hypothetical protein